MKQKRNWNEVYIAQNEILKTLKGIGDIFLAGGTAIQRFVISQKYRHSEDLDFFIDSYDDVKYKKTISNINQALSDNQSIKIENIVSDKEIGSYRIFCSIKDLDEKVKVELLNFTDGRYKDKSFLSNQFFHKIENPYNLILYKLKALCDRHDTMKDLFDLYFLFREYEKYPIDINQLFIDLNLKFHIPTNYYYNIKDISDALNASCRKWDIVLSKEFIDLENDIKKAINEFRKDFFIQINSDSKKLDLSYKKRFLDKDISQEENLYYNYIENNSFITTHVNIIGKPK